MRASRTRTWLDQNVRILVRSLIRKTRNFWLLVRSLWILVRSLITKTVGPINVLKLVTKTRNLWILVRSLVATGSDGAPPFKPACA